MVRMVGRLAVIGLSAVLVLFLFGNTAPGSLVLGAIDAATPTPDRLALPVMPQSPTQVDVGRNLYYYHCMPCHGDRGQGLTAEWRQVWVEDHQDCWAGGCHAGREGDEGFALPRYVPPVSGSPQAIADFVTADQLFDFLSLNHPPQRPGALADEEYWALTAFLLYESGRLPSSDALVSTETVRSTQGWGLVFAIALGALFVAIFVLTQKRHRADGRETDTTNVLMDGQSPGTRLTTRNDDR